MVLLHCRECGAEIASDTRKTKCEKCGTLFPFACAVCGKLLNPPIPDYPIERYFTPDRKPLCEEHYQRQCPECQKWFQASENPGYFLCTECTAKRPPVTASSGSGVSGDSGDYILAASDDTAPVERPRRNRAVRKTYEAAEVEADEEGATRSKSGCGLGMLCLMVVITFASVGWHYLAASLLSGGR
ncbi:MAG: hypothetical protein JO316_03930 [Abitibacteriaceae bacterium]|nr:hypothetical protein [Abditibacteriaceae bacterium]